jgi:hypothetical protein
MQIQSHQVNNGTFSCNTATLWAHEVLSINYIKGFIHQTVLGTKARGSAFTMDYTVEGVSGFIVV